MTIRPSAAGALVVAALVGIAYVTKLQHQLAASRANERALALRASNEAALHDTTRDAARDNARLARLLGDSLRAYRKLVVQREQPPDRMDLSLGGRHAGVYAMRVAIRPLEAALSRAEADSGTAFHLRQQPYTLDAHLSPPSASDSASLAVRVTLDTIPLTTRLQCSPPGDAGIRTASVVTTAPPWAAIRIGEVQQDPEVCNAVKSDTRPSRRLLSWSPVTLSVGRQLGVGRSGWSLQLGTGLTFGAVR